MVSFQQQFIAAHPDRDYWVTRLKDGCDLADHCRDCPMSRCRFDDDDWFQAAVHHARDLTLVEALKLYDRNYSLTARTLGCSINQLYRAGTRVARWPHSPLTRAEFLALAMLPKQPYRDWVLRMLGEAA